MGFGSGALRLFLSVIVVFSHIDLFHFGVAAVGTFFTLSGYWVGRMWLKKYSAGPYPISTFLISRCWRIYPAAVCAVLFARLWCGYDPVLEWSSLTLFTESTTKSLPTTWSLVAEIEYYALVPLAVPVVVLALASKRRAAFGLVALVIWALLAGSYSMQLTALGWIPLFVTGLAAAMHDWKPSARLALASLIACLCVASLVLLHPFFFDVWLLSFAVAPFALWTATLPSSKLDKFLGQLSYTLYLVHWPLVTHLTPLKPIFWIIPLIGVNVVQFGLSFIGALILLAIEWPSELCRRKFVRWANRPRTLVVQTRGFMVGRSS